MKEKLKVGEIMIRITEWSTKKRNAYVTRFLERSAFPEEAEKAASNVLADIRARGDIAVAEAVEKFEGAKLAPRNFRVTDKELALAEKSVSPAIKRAVRDAYKRVMAFQRPPFAKAGP